MVTTEDVLAVVARSPHNWGSGRRKWLEDEMAEVVEETLQSLMESERFRGSLLVRLCWASSQTPASLAILQEFVRSGSKDEAVMATRTLCGHRLMRVDAFLPADLRQRVRETYDPAPDVYGRVPPYWIPGPDAEALMQEAGYPDRQSP